MSNKTEELLPIGSIVLLKEGLQKLMIVGRGTIYTDQETGKDTFADYMAVLYPTGLNPETTIFFNHENTDQVVFRGYSDEEETRFLEVYEEWKKNLENSSKKEQ
ncbi:DUF4176 domain-containing protein [Enterococcus hirae]|uniref:DUF4176 domain-containing protein n=1 Tax=Enterococcus sp. C63 TaxID=3231324 RepID=UPI0019FEB811|nr:DUF4176 domain-containing protein [Enterococcus hirae]EMF0130828.1 DUF4176 domain-containing protein [Enterococcus hirae]EMF0450540.1 DUF4176 domain-containing protein [Enterococcus hirae]EMF0516656.1 DUF4176 domain-containing protein [Enterococcus hirae]EMF0519845.1 DUF4176 domain-containing protein [Enterococcus hirae]